MFNWLFRKLLDITFGFSSDEEWSCKRKVWYRSKAAAKKAYIAMKSKGTLDHEVEAYKCKYCGRWHLRGLK